MHVAYYTVDVNTIDLLHAQIIYTTLLIAVTKDGISTIDQII